MFIFKCPKYLDLMATFTIELTIKVVNKRYFERKPTDNF